MQFIAKHMTWLQGNLHNGRLDMHETSSSVAVVIGLTVPVSCPPCSMTLRIVNPVGLTISTCSLTFTAYDSPMTTRTVNVRAVQTAGSNSRATRLQFHPVETFATGSGWDDYTMQQIPVRSSTITLHMTYDTRNYTVIQKVEPLCLRLVTLVILILFESNLQISKSFHA